MTPEELAAIRERAAAATEGPWIAEFSGEQGNCVLPHDAQSTREAVAITRLYHQVFDAEFIAHAREDVPALLDHADTLQDRLDKVRALVGEIGAEGCLGYDECCAEPVVQRIAQAIDGSDQ